MRRNAKTRTLFQVDNIDLGKHDVEVTQIFGHPPHFDVIALADDERVITLADQFGDATVREAHERASGFHDLQPAASRPLQRGLGRAMSGNHYGPCLDRADLLRDFDATRAQIVQHGLIVHQVAKHR